MMSLTACAAKTSEPIQTSRALPPLYGYSAAFQSRAADELEMITARPCPRQWADDGCSAVKTMIVDYKTVRDGLRVLGAGKQ